MIVGKADMSVELSFHFSHPLCLCISQLECFGKKRCEVLTGSTRFNVYRSIKFLSI